MTTVAVIQSRMNSNRFPGKALAPLAGKPMILHAIQACHKAFVLDEIVVATSNHASDDPLYHYLKSVYTFGAKWYRGSLTDPLERTYEAARELNATKIVRVTADCPLVDYRSIQRAVEQVRDLDYWGVTNSPDGTDVEIISMYALREANLHASTKEREHTTTWIRHAGLKRQSFEGDPDYADVHYSVNSVEDLKVCEQILAITGENARWQDHVEAYRKIKAQ